MAVISKHIFGLLLGAALFVSGQLRAENQPTLFPTRDAVILYKQQAGAFEMGQIQIFYSASTKRTRTNTEKFNVFIITDHIANRMLQVTPGNPPMYRENAIPPATSRYSSTGRTETIAGQRCEVWQVYQAATPKPATQCITSDGLMLRSVNEGLGGNMVMEAVAISYAPQNPSLFQLPPGATRQ